MTSSPFLYRLASLLAAFCLAPAAAFAADAEGFEPIFNGRDFDGWTGATANYEVKDGAIVCRPKQGGTIYTKRIYRDFVVRLQIKLPPAGDNGLAIRYPGEGIPAFTGMCELQVLDDSAPKYAHLDPRRRHGSAYGMVPSRPGFLRPVGEWNDEVVTVRGSTIKVVLNGTVVLDCDLSRVTEFFPEAGFSNLRPYPGKDRVDGHFGFAGHGDPVMFRQIAIRALPSGSTGGGADSASNFGYERRIDPRWFPTDARQWTGYDRSIVLSDLSRAEPAAALTTGLRRKGKWKVLPFATQDFQGQALSAYPQTEPQPVHLALGATGWHAVYVGVGTMRKGMDGAHDGTGVRAKLGGYPVYKEIANTLNTVEPARDVIQEQFLTVADLAAGETLEIASLPLQPGTVLYVRLVPLTSVEKLAWQHDLAAAGQRNEAATNDGHSWIWPYLPQTADDLRLSFEGFPETDVGQWWFTLLGADLSCYPTKVGTIAGEGTEDFPTNAHGDFTRSVQTLIANGVNPLAVAARTAKAQGREFHLFIRPQGWGASIPFEETFNSRFYRDHPEWRCVDREGRQAMYMSYAVPEVRRHVLAFLREAMAISDPAGVGFFFNRGIPMMLWEKPFADQFRSKYGVEIMQVGAEDPRILRLRAEIVTGFFEEVQVMLKELAASRPGKHYTVSATTFTEKRFNDRFGLDVETWVKRGLVDQLAVASPTRFYDKENRPPDVDYYHRIVAGTRVRVLPFVVTWDITPGKPAMPLQDFCREVIAWYQAGADGVALWDPAAGGGYRLNQAEGNSLDLLGCLGHRPLVAYWAEHGVPAPHAFPLLRLGDNEYSAWLPNRGY